MWKPTLIYSKYTVYYEIEKKSCILRITLYYIIYTPNGTYSPISWILKHISPELPM